MIKVSVMYPYKEGADFDMAYYLEKHIPMVREKLGEACTGATVEQGLAGGAAGAPPLYIALGHLLFESVEAFQTSFGPHGPAIMADVPNYTTIQPVVQISEVKIA